MKILKTANLAILGAGLALLAAGCSTAGMQAGAARDTASPYLVLDDRGLANQVSIVRVHHDHAGDLMRAHVTLKSNRGRTLRMQYRFSWYDAQGMEIDPAGRPYRDLVLEGRETVAVTSMAPSPAAEEFKIRVRQLKNVR